MSLLGYGYFYTYSGFEHCSSAVIGQSRPAIVVGENPDGTLDVQVITNGRADGFIQSMVSVQGVMFGDSAIPGALAKRPATGSTAKERQEEQDELARVELARVVAEAEAKQAAERAAAKATEDAREAERLAQQEEKRRTEEELQRLRAEAEALDVFEATRASRERATTAVMDADDAKTPPGPVAPEVEQSAPVATPVADPSSTP